MDDFFSKFNILVKEFKTVFFIVVEDNEKVVVKVESLLITVDAFNVDEFSLIVDEDDNNEDGIVKLSFFIVVDDNNDVGIVELSFIINVDICETCFIIDDDINDVGIVVTFFIIEVDDVGVDEDNSGIYPLC